MGIKLTISFLLSLRGNSSKLLGINFQDLNHLESADFSFVKYGFYKVGCDGSFALDEYGSAKVTRMSGSSQNSHHFLSYLKQNTIFTSVVATVL